LADAHAHNFSAGEAADGQEKRKLCSPIFALAAMRIGLISDTHNLLREEARQALAGVDHIVHAGDICTREVLDALAAIAPVTAVRGNNDQGAWADELPASARVRFERVAVLVVHDLATIAGEPEHAIDVVVSGHSHRPRIERRGSVLYVNPGSAGPRRFRLPVSVGFLTVCGGDAQAELLELPVG
jgi:putative phosphoesterase